jgi:hypothetical protein
MLSGCNVGWSSLKTLPKAGTSGWELRRAVVTLPEEEGCDGRRRTA